MLTVGIVIRREGREHADLLQHRRHVCLGQIRDTPRHHNAPAAKAAAERIVQVPDVT
jgi:hypothetical protein